MASSLSTPRLRTSTERRAPNPIVLWHLLSLDAPTVATLWTWFIARACHLRLPWESLAAMAFAVWILYAADRLLDARILNALPLAKHEELEPRHHFHHRHRPAFLAGIALCSLALTPLLLRLPAEALRLYLIEGALLVAWFLIIHISSGSRRLPKELAVGPFFAAATFIPTVSRLPAERPALLAPAILFSALCSLNCLYIYAWEHSGPKAKARHPERSEGFLHFARSSGGNPHPTTRFALNLLPLLTPALAIAGALLATLEPAIWRLPAACALSALALLTLHRLRARLDPTILRAAADLALLTPLLLLLSHFG
ncbi:hypothetical protein SAMN05421770_10638 [Granulicella rosea]|uniref:4-hydroxybenzoate polyprenyltransferase n=1 Tax=Granulicella rosea TaxID=474952 RepID=A0A239L129_9BACT|nr:hypothetical protein [Granulicella rosea]SNT24297.1 hypothetical protein SAMN05421770_10638 [Granulicella rosea]